MIFCFSNVNGCTYTLSPDDDSLMYAPMYADDSYETTLSAYDYVDWDCIEDDHNCITEAKRCQELLLTNSITQN